MAVACDFGGRMSCEFGDIDDEMLQFKWYLCPIEIQKMLLIFIPNAQQPVNFECFGSISSNRETLAKV